MSDPVDFAEYLERQRAKLAKLQADAKRSAEQASADYREWEQVADKSRIVGISYPWQHRPAELPISPSELELVFKLAKANFRVAARMLKVSPERLAIATHGTKWQRKQAKPIHDELVTAWQDGLRTVVRIKRPSGNKQLSMGFDEAGNLLIIIDRTPSDNVLALVERAEEVLRDKE